MFNVIAEQFAALQKSNLEQAAKAANFAFQNTERAFAWNFGVAKQFAADSLQTAKKVSEVKDVQVFAAISNLGEGKAEQLAELGRAAYDQLSKSQAETVKFVEGAAAEMNAAFVKFVDGVAKASPVGGEALSQGIKQLVAAQQSAAAQASAQFKQASNVIEGQFKQAAAQASSAAATVKKAARK